MLPMITGLCIPAHNAVIPCRGAGVTPENRGILADFIVWFDFVLLFCVCNGLFWGLTDISLIWCLFLLEGCVTGGGGCWAQPGQRRHGAHLGGSGLPQVQTI